MIRGYRGDVRVVRGDDIGGRADGEQRWTKAISIASLERSRPTTILYHLLLAISLHRHRERLLHTLEAMRIVSSAGRLTVGLSGTRQREKKSNDDAGLCVESAMDGREGQVPYLMAAQSTALASQR